MTLKTKNSFTLYDFSKIESKWNNEWSAKKKISTPLKEKNKQKFYCLSQFPYPSGNLHMGHARVYYISDSISRYELKQGKEVFHPMGWDAFGLPAENAAISRNISPSEWTYNNIEEMRNQMKELGLLFDWENEIFTCNEDYYKWTQYIFLKLYEKGYAYRGFSEVNWDPVDQTVLANEQVDIHGKSWRSGALVEKKKLEQWFIKTTLFSKQLVNDLNKLEKWPLNVKELQKGWIGLKKGMFVKFKIYDKINKNNIGEINIFTTRIETIFGVCFLGVSKDHVILNEKNFEQKFNNIGKNFKDIEGVLINDLEGENPITKERVPIYACSYVLNDYGTGAIMGVPAHDERDKDLAIKLNLPFKYVINKENTHLINSDKYTDMTIEIAVKQIKQFIIESGNGNEIEMTNMKDWLISRQRYWGVPIPIIYCKNCGILPVLQNELPVKLPKINDFGHLKSGRILIENKEFYECKCYKCKGEAHRETDTLDTFFDSSWYFLRYQDSKNHNKIFQKENIEKWLPVDVYIGGMEHAILHLLYARFMHKFLCENNEFSFPDEPFKQLITQGHVKSITYKLKENGKFLRTDEISNYDKNDYEISYEKMSKSKGNGINPLDIVKDYGSDCLRISILFHGPNEKDIIWDPNFPKILLNFLNKIWKFSENIIKEANFVDFKLESNEKLLFISIIELIENYLLAVSENQRSFHVAIARLMEILNKLEDFRDKNLNNCSCLIILMKIYLQISYPLIPHISNELLLGFENIKFADEWKSIFLNDENNEFLFPDINFLKNLILGKDMIKTKILLNNKFQIAITFKKEDFENDEKIFEILQKESNRNFINLKKDKIRLIKSFKSDLSKWSTINMIELKN